MGLHKIGKSVAIFLVGYILMFLSVILSIIVVIYAAYTNIREIIRGEWRDNHHNNGGKTNVR